jgi:hypothetical protein
LILFERSDEVRRVVASALIALMLQIITTGIFAQTNGDNSKNRLTVEQFKSDPLLKSPFTSDLKRPTVRELLAVLEKTTSLKFSVNDMVEMNQEAFGSLSFVKVPAWVVMMELANSEAVKGSWEKTENGYHLVGTLDRKAQEARLLKLGAPPRSPTAPSPPPERSWLLPIIFSVIAIVTLTLGFYRWRRKRQGQGNNAASL